MAGVMVAQLCNYPANHGIVHFKMGELYNMWIIGQLKKKDKNCIMSAWETVHSLFQCNRKTGKKKRRSREVISRVTSEGKGFQAEIMWNSEALPVETAWFTWGTERRPIWLLFSKCGHGNEYGVLFLSTVRRLWRVLKQGMTPSCWNFAKILLAVR